MATIELLSPAGTLRNLGYALAYGADAVYAGMPRYSLRVRNNDFQQDNLALGIAQAHEQGRKFFLAANLLPHEAKLKTFIKDMEPLIAMGPDALIMADPGLMLMVRERWPGLAIHLSVQANTLNSAAVRFWQRQGLQRVILSRELSLEEIEAIRQACPDMELEVFVHGALCIAYSGRCLLSGYFNHRDANQGSCTNACRWAYGVRPGTGEAGLNLGLDADARPARPPGPQQNPEQGWVLEEANRPGEFMPIEEDEAGTYILNSKDLRAVEYVQHLVRIGVDSLKIEGRTKSHYYVARATQVYRRAIDDALAGRDFDPGLMTALEGLAHRGYTPGFLQRHPDQSLQNYSQGVSSNDRQIFVAEVLEQGSEGWCLLESKNAFGMGDRLELLDPAGNLDFQLEGLRSLEGEALERVPGGSHRVWAKLPRWPGAHGLIARYLGD